MLPTDLKLASQHALRRHERGIPKDGTQPARLAWREVDQEEREVRRVGGEEAATRKGGFGDEERDWWGFSGRRRVMMRWISRGGGGMSVDDTFELAQVSRPHLPLFGFALGEDAQPSAVC
jgi:hypothetical protein